MTNKTMNYIKKHEILSFAIITYLCSWSIWGILYSSSIGIINNYLYREYHMLLISLGSFMPSTIAIILTGVLYRRKGLKKLLIRLTIWKVNPIYFVFVIGYFGAVYYILFLICSILGYDTRFDFVRNPYQILIIAIFMLFFGPLGEEIGWRGFLLPRLQKKLSPFHSSLIIGIVWACWHLPLFFIVGTGQYSTSFPLFLFIVINLAILFTWIYNRTKGSLILSILFHDAIDPTVSLMNRAASVNLHMYIIIVVQLAIVICISFDMIKRKHIKYTV